MKRFKFRLRRLQAVRKQEADAARRVLVEATAGLVRCEQRISTIDQLAAECRHESVATSPVQALAAGMLRGLDSARGRAQRMLALAERQVNVARTTFVERRAASEAIIKLHAAKRGAWQASIAAAERAELEEMSRLARHAQARRVDDRNAKDAPAARASVATENQP